LIGSLYVCAVAGLTVEMIRNPATRGGGARVSFWRAWRNFALLTTRPVVRFVLMAVALESFAMFGAFTYVGATLHLRFGFNFAAIGLTLAAYCLGGLFYVSQSRAMIMRLGPSGLAFWGSAIVAAAYVALALTPSAWVFPPAIAVMGLGFYMLHNTLQTFATQMAPEARGSAVAMFATSYFLSQAIGVLVAGRVMDVAGPTPIFLAAALLLYVLGFGIRRFIPRALEAG
jgi:YNFM family putative membrane transporter